MISVEFLCKEGRKKLRHLRREARKTGEEDVAYDLVLRAAELKCGISVRDSLLGPGFEEVFRAYHRSQWSAFIWIGRSKEGVDNRTNGDYGRHFFRTIDWVYGNLPNEKVKGQSGTLRFDRNF